MSDAEPQELKGGHAPAVKVGGMRIVQHKTPQKDDKPAEPVKSSEEEEEEFVEERKEKKASSVVISGAKTGESDAYPKEAVQAFHEKPMPTHQMGASTKPKVIQQPRK